MKKLNPIFIVVLSLIAINAFASTTLITPVKFEVALTFDDLPFQGATNINEKISDQQAIGAAKKIMAVLKKHHVPPTWGMLNAKAITLHSEMIRTLKLWIASGNKLGNHTYSHIDLAKVSSKDFIANIKNNEPLLKKLMKNKNFRIFRYPFLSYGNTKEKYQTVHRYLTTSGYQIAYVTMDFFDSEWSQPYQRCLKMKNKTALQWLRKSYLQQSLNAITIAHHLSQQLFHRDIKYILLLHFSNIQADALDQLLTNFEQYGVKFISLESALQDPVYQIDPKIYRDRAYTLLNRIRLSRGLSNPKIVSQLYATLPEGKLNSICKVG